MRPFRPRSEALRIASLTSFAFPNPKPTRPFLSPMTIKALKEKRRPPFTTLAQRLMKTVFSTNSLPVVGTNTPSTIAPSIAGAASARGPRGPRPLPPPPGPPRPGPRPPGPPGPRFCRCCGCVSVVAAGGVVGVSSAI